MGTGYIKVETKGNTDYATHFISFRDGKKVKNKTVYLGKVIDINLGIFETREKGIYQYSVTSGFSEAPKEFKEQAFNSINSFEYIFGDVWLLNEIIKQTNYIDILKQIVPNDTDTLISIILFRLIDKGYSNKYADEWWQDSYAKFLYPKAKLKSQRISEFYKKIGEESIWSHYFDIYIPFLLQNYHKFSKNKSQHLKKVFSKKNKSQNVQSNDLNPILTDLSLDLSIDTDIDDSNLIDKEIENTDHKMDNINENDENMSKFSVIADSTGLPNSIKIPITSVNNHNGIISNEIRLIFVIDKKTGFPLYFRYVAGNIVDVTTLKATIAELNGYNININHVVVDAGYYSDDNIKILYSLNISFIIRLIKNRKTYKELVDQYINDLATPKHMVLYGQRILYVKKVKITLLNHSAFAYLMLDYDSNSINGKKFALKALRENQDRDSMELNMKMQGLFILLSSDDIDIHDILPIYYTRQDIEQFFDILKTDASVTPIRTHTEPTFRGHLFESCISGTIIVMLNNLLYGSNYSGRDALHASRSLKIKIFKNNYVIREPNKKMNEIIKYLDLKIPFTSGALLPVC